MAYVERLKGPAAERYGRKLALCGLANCPYSLPQDVWINDPTEWPAVTFPQVMLYLIRTPGVHTLEAMNNYKSLSSYRVLQSGWVQTVFHTKTYMSTVLKADVVPSYKVNEAAHHPWVAVDGKGNVQTAHCDCKAGLGESCSHIGALLYKIELVIRMGGGCKSCTDELCAWNHAEWKGVPPGKLKDIHMYASTSKKSQGKFATTTASQSVGVH